MRKSQDNYLNMAIAVMQHFANHVNVWINTKIVALYREKVNQTVEEIKTARLKQTDSNPVGHTASKAQTRDVLETTLYQVALCVRSYAGVTENEVLLEKTNFSRSALYILRENDLCSIAMVIVNVCMEHLSELAEYGIDQTIVDNLRNLANQLQTLYAQRDIVIDERMEATAHIEQLLKQLRKQLKTLDDLVEVYIKDDTFVSTYFNSRRIHDIRGRRTKKEDNE
ncbi:MAG: hypothetical protein LBG80_08625 [Bacteroidales bacterium]|jgi:enamine deaminase RidA (YjgF/YER057c/UK114 family)|nr:hypothetical protein [Bacteroidales bacterium]